MSAASGEAGIKMAECQSGQYKLWHGQLMAELNWTYGWALPLQTVKWSVWSSLPCQPSETLVLIADQDGSCSNVPPIHWEENFHLCPCHLCGGNWLWERVWQVRFKFILAWCNFKTCCKFLASCQFNDLRFLQLCWLPLGDSEQGQAVEGHQSEVWNWEWRGGVNAKIT